MLQAVDIAGVVSGGRWSAKGFGRGAPRPRELVSAMPLAATPTASGAVRAIVVPHQQPAVTDQ